MNAWTVCYKCHMHMGAPHCDTSCGSVAVCLMQTLFHKTDTWIPSQCCESLSESWAVHYWWTSCHMQHSGGVCLWSGSVDVLLFAVHYKPSHKTHTPLWVAEGLCCFWLHLTSHVCHLSAWKQKNFLSKYFYIMNYSHTDNYREEEYKITHSRHWGAVQVVIIIFYHWIECIT